MPDYGDLGDLGVSAGDYCADGGWLEPLIILMGTRIVLLIFYARWYSLKLLIIWFWDGSLQTKFVLNLDFDSNESLESERTGDSVSSV